MVLNPDFIRQLCGVPDAARSFQNCRWSITVTRPQVQRERIALIFWHSGLATGAKKWKWAVHQLLEGVEEHARAKFGCERRGDERPEHMADNLDALSTACRLQSANANQSLDRYMNSTPSCTRGSRKCWPKCAPRSSVLANLLYLFNAVPTHEHENPFEQDAEDALNYPLNLPEEDTSTLYGSCAKRF